MLIRHLNECCILLIENKKKDYLTLSTCKLIVINLVTLNASL